MEKKHLIFQLNFKEVHFDAESTECWYSFSQNIGSELRLATLFSTWVKWNISSMDLLWARTRNAWPRYSFLWLDVEYNSCMSHSFRLQSTLNKFMGLGSEAWVETRSRLQELLGVNCNELKGNNSLKDKYDTLWYWNIYLAIMQLRVCTIYRALIPMSTVTMHLPAEIGTPRLNNN